MAEKQLNLLYPKKDNNNSHEGDQIRDYINQFDNVYLCNGDRHWQYVTHFEGTNLWEFSCGAGADIHAGGWSQEDVRPEHCFLRVKGGFLRGMVTRNNGTPTLTFQHRDVDGNVVHEEVFRSKTVEKIEHKKTGFEESDSFQNN